MEQKQKLTLTNEDWKRILTPIQFQILRQGGTEKPFTGGLLYNKHRGTYHCIACGNLLFYSKDKFQSGTGWPSFTQPATKNSFEYIFYEFKDGVEVRCKKCKGHHGHVFFDGPIPKSTRFCVNSAVLKFERE